MLRGLLRWGQKGSGKGARVFHQGGLSLRGMSAEPPTPNSLYRTQTFCFIITTSNTMSYLSIEGTSMTIDHSALTKGQVRKLNALRKSVGDDIAEDAFGKWMKSQSKTPKDVRDPVADALVAALDQFKDDKTFRLGAKGYVVKRSKGKGASGFVVQKVT
jgi:hypothetical protein